MEDVKQMNSEDKFKRLHSVVTSQYQVLCTVHIYIYMLYSCVTGCTVGLFSPLLPQNAWVIKCATLGLLQCY